MVGRLANYVADPPHDRQLGKRYIIYAELCVGMWLLGLDDLLDGNGAQRVSLVFATCGVGILGKAVAASYEAAAIVRPCGAVTGVGVVFARMN